jgi:hypothetical protein
MTTSSLKIPAPLFLLRLFSEASVRSPRSLFPHVERPSALSPLATFALFRG